MSEQIPEDRRREVFKALVEAQDGGLSVAASRAKVVAEQGITAEDVLAIEKEGLENEWPPLG
jgi:hypothetical protein